MKKFILFIFLIQLSGCVGLATGKLYDGAELSNDRHVVLSNAGVYKERKTGVQIIEINGKAVDTERTSEFLLLPGEHTIKARATKDLKVSVQITNINLQNGKYSTNYATNQEEYILSFTQKFIAGHTYIPNVEITTEKQRLYFDDVGENFNRECLPTRRYAIFYGGSSDGKKSGCQ